MAPETPAQVIDLDATEEEPMSFVRVGGEVYPVRSLLDIPLDRIRDVSTVQDQVRGKKWHEQLEVARELLAHLIPTLPEEKRRALSGRQIIRIMGEILGIAFIAVGALAPGKPQE